MQPQVDVLFEATEAGCAAQAEQLKAVVSPATVIESGPAVWKGRQELYSEAAANSGASALAKISVLPIQISEAYEAVAALGVANRARFNAVFYAIGIGTIYLAAPPNELANILKNLRGKFEQLGGSLVVAHRPDAMPTLGAWGDAGDALELMRAVKKQFDPKSMLNSGRFVGGI
jgi:glycolate oxidase FAD binding subunit